MSIKWLIKFSWNTYFILLIFSGTKYLLKGFSSFFEVLQDTDRTNLEYLGTKMANCLITGSPKYLSESAERWHNSHIPYIWLFWLCEILALLGQNGGKEIMAHINFGSPRVWAKITLLLKLSYYLKWQNVCRCIACILVQSVKSNSVQK